MSQAIAFVVPRYRSDSKQGIEAVIREMAEGLQQNGVPVEVLTTCTDDLTTWNNHHQPGSIMMNGIPVRRFQIDAVDRGAYSRITEAAIDSSERLPYREQQLLLANSINSSQLCDYLQENSAQYHCCILGPYFAGTTYFAARIMNGKAVHIPFLQDDRFARFDIFREMLEEASGIFFMTNEEERLARDELGITNPQAIVVDGGERGLSSSGQRTNIAPRTLLTAIDTFVTPRTLYQELSQRGRRRALEYTDARYADKLHELVDVALGDLEFTNTYTAQVEKIAPLAHITRPKYRVTSRIPIVGRLIAWARGQLTSHTREAYLDPILQRQEQFNLAMQSQVARLAQLVASRHDHLTRAQMQRHNAELVMLRAQVARIEAQLSQQDVAELGRDSAELVNQAPPVE